MKPRHSIKAESRRATNCWLRRRTERFDQFRGKTDEELAGWLAAILANTIKNSIRKFGPNLARREQSLDMILHQSAQGLESILAADQSTPSQRAMRRESLLRLADALARS
jgi:DNA-directed RNA polymerase specialized sigma24 family protein